MPYSSIKYYLIVLLFCSPTIVIRAQELNAKVTINHSQIQGQSNVFETLQKSLVEFMNNTHWTNDQYAVNERIDCSFTMNITKYDASSGQMTGTMLILSSRPVYNSVYTTTVFNIKDANIDFTYQEFDKLQFRSDMIDNNLTAIMAYYAYLIIGLDMDTMSPKGGTDILQLAMTVANNAQSLGNTGWKAFEDSKNRFAIINDYLDGGMEPFRQLMYNYYRKGLDVMSTSSERGRDAITDAMSLLKQAHENKPLSMIPQIFTDYKKDELVNIYNGKDISKNKESISDILVSINASQSTYWDKIKK